MHGRLPHYVLWRLDKGHLTLVPEGERAIEVGPGSWVLIPPDRKRLHRFSRDASILSLHFWAGWHGHRPLFQIPEVLVRSCAAWGALGRPSERLVARARKGPPMALCSFFQAEQVRWRWFEVLASCLDEEGYVPCRAELQDARLARVIDILEPSAYQGRLPYEELCRAAGLSRVQLDRLFRKHLGCSPRRFFEEQLYRRATDLLAQIEAPLKAVAGELGFASPDQFNRWFRRVGGMPPGAYRRQVYGSAPPAG